MIHALLSPASAMPNPANVLLNPACMLLNMAQRLLPPVGPTHDEQTYDYDTGSLQSQQIYNATLILHE